MELKDAYNYYHKNILAVSFHLCGNLEDAEDVMQEVFIRYARNKDKLDNFDNVRAWLYRVAINLCFDKKRYMKRATNYLTRMFKAETEDSSSIKKIEIDQELNQVLKEFDDKTKMLIILKYMEEMDYQEISKIMETPVGTLKSMASRALSKIKNKGELLWKNKILKIN